MPDAGITAKMSVTQSMRPVTRTACARGRDAVTSTASASTEEIVWDTRATGRAVAGVPEDIIPAVPTGRAAIAENI